MTRTHRAYLERRHKDDLTHALLRQAVDDVVEAHRALAIAEHDADHWAATPALRRQRDAECAKARRRLTQRITLLATALEELTPTTLTPTT